MVVYSAQQIKFEFLSYIKEFGGRPADWHVGCAPDAQTAMFEHAKVDPEHDIWLWKPTLSPAAALIVYRYLTEQLGVNKATPIAAGPNIFLYKRAPQAGA